MSQQPDATNEPPWQATDDAPASALGDQPATVVGPQGFWAALLAKHRWLGFVLPLVVFMLAGQLEQPFAASDPTATVEDREADPFADDEATDAVPDRFALTATDQSPSALRYPIAYAIRIALTLAAMLLVLPVYRQFTLRVNWLAILVGGIGAAVWIGLCNLQRNFLVLPDGVAAWLGGARVGYDPTTELGDRPAVLAGFLAVRFLGLALIVPIIEEFFLRGFLARFVSDADWWKVPIGAASGSAIAAIVAYAALTHPSEAIAAVAWFLLVTWLVARTQNLWDAVAAHATTNLLLGLWVLAIKQFWLW